MKNEKKYQNLRIYAKWRDRLVFVLLFFVVCILITEIAYFFMYYQHDTGLVNDLRTAKYLLFFLIIPTVINFSGFFVAYFMNKCSKYSSNTKNWIVGLVMMAVCGNTIAVHYVFPPLLCMICIPVFLTTVFGSKRLTSCAVVIALFSMVISLLKATDNYFIPEVSGYFKDDPNLMYNYFIGFLALICCSIGSNVIISYQNEKNQEILENYKKQEELHELLKLDSLTKIYNHSSIYEIIEESLLNIDDINLLSLAMIDIDNFKAVNDRYGHINGDEVLTRLATILRSYSSETVVCARYGGEEFAILFVNHSLDDAVKIIENIKNDFITSDFSFVDKEMDSQITFSCGITSLSQEYVSPSEFFSRADIALYSAKDLGKNCISFYVDKDKKSVRIKEKK